MAAGLHWFLKYACNSSISWSVTGGHNIDNGAFTPEALARMEQQVGMHRKRSVPWHYYQNVVTPRSELPCEDSPDRHCTYSTEVRGAHQLPIFLSGMPAPLHGSGISTARLSIIMLSIINYNAPGMLLLTSVADGASP